ncbi:MAG: polysaccharide deacetylase family protein, partial [Gemmatimonadaceae bacterium]
LFARTRAELDTFNPVARPAYRDAVLDPFTEPTGTGEQDDPLHFAPSLIADISRTPRQEIATHTFSHYYCGEPGQSVEEFRADIEAARAIAARDGIELRSIVFPRNQHRADYDAVLLENGITCYRGNPTSWMWRFESSEQSAGVARRAARLADAYAPFTGANTQAWDEVLQPNGLANVRASRFLRPCRPTLRAAEPLRAYRIRSSIHRAAREGRIFHLWWHPHNFGVYQDENLAFLRSILDEVAVCRSRYGMLSLTMGEVAGMAREITSVAGAGDASCARRA